MIGSGCAVRSSNSAGPVVPASPATRCSDCVGKVKLHDVDRLRNIPSRARPFRNDVHDPRTKRADRDRFPDRRSMRCITPLCAMITWWRMGSTTSCSGSCFQCAIPAPEESSAMRNGSVLSTRAISASAARRSDVERSSGCASGAGRQALVRGIAHECSVPGHGVAPADQLGLSISRPYLYGTARVLCAAIAGRIS